MWQHVKDLEVQGGSKKRRSSGSDHLDLENTIKSKK